MKIGHQGIFGAFSYIAAKKFYPNAEIVSYNSFQDVAEAVFNDKVKYGILPFENSYTGKVENIKEIIEKYDFNIIAKKPIKISHCLCGVKEINLQEITHIHSHNQALMQCNKTIAQLMPNVVKIQKENTAISAEFVSKLKDPTQVAICSKLAAERFGLYILKDDFQDADDNQTIFVIFEK